MKRFFDVTISLVLVILLCPLILLLIVLIRFKLGTPVFFTQWRPGLKGKPFLIYKFRTMTDGRDEQGVWLPDEQRITPFGRFLRRFSLDELPQLLNVIKGELSLVGPRPLMMEYLPLYTPEQARRHDVKPGITGWAQIHGRNALTWEEKFELDVWYVDHRSFLIDLRILWLTFTKVFNRKETKEQADLFVADFTGTPVRSTATEGHQEFSDTIMNQKTKIR
ncbi:sugar transferase [Brevibacillus ginsengisoli]|uniref:sugar transferase n=1 Tax=Brevibacillus ginsengisoli TaxID=363854 RepID=UPI003CE862D6